MEEDQPGFQFELQRAFFGCERMAGDEQVIAGLKPVHVQSHDQPLRVQDGVQAVGHEILHRLQPVERAAVFVAEADIAPNVVDCPSRFLATNEAVLVSALHGEIGVAPDPNGAKANQSGFG